MYLHVVCIIKLHCCSRICFASVATLISTASIDMQMLACYTWCTSQNYRVYLRQNLGVGERGRWGNKERVGGGGGGGTHPATLYTDKVLREIMIA